MSAARQLIRLEISLIDESTMSDSLKELLEAERQAEAIVANGEQERDQIVQKSLTDAREMETQFLARLPEMQNSFNQKAHQRAERTIAEMKLRYDERSKMLRDLAEKHEREALELATRLILDQDQSAR